MPCTRQTLQLQGTWNLAQYIQAIKSAFALLSNTVLFSEFENTTTNFLVFEITYDETKTYGKAYIKIAITKANLNTIHTICTGWDKVGNVLGTGNFESAVSVAQALTNTETVFIQVFDSPTNEFKAVSFTNQVSARNYLVALSNPQLNRDTDVNNPNTKFLFGINNTILNPYWMLPNNNNILPYPNCPQMIEAPHFIGGGNPSGSPDRVITGISLFPSPVTNALRSCIFAGFSDDIGICFANNNNAGTKMTTAQGTYYLVSKSATQSYAIKCDE